MAWRMGLLGKKVGMTQTFDEKGNWAALSVIEVGPCFVVDKKTKERDGYCALVLGFDEKKPQRAKKPQAGLFTKAKTKPLRFLKEIRLTPEELEQFAIGQALTVDQVFSAGDPIDVCGTSKGKGFQGVMKKYHFSGFRSSHGVHEYFRHGGSIGCRLTPGRVVKGKKMPGQMGNHRVTVQNLKVREILAEKNVILVPGAVPGAPGGLVEIRHAAKRQPRPFVLLKKAETEPPAEDVAGSAPEPPPDTTPQAAAEAPAQS